jgi:glyoxylase-like metal-dependent hydrolase (beta-lactamase superfamily II)
MGNFLKTRVGNVELIAVQDSWFKRPPGDFFVGVDTAAWEPYKEWLDDDGMMSHNFGTFIIHSQGQTLLVDTGLGMWDNPLSLEMNASLPTVIEEAGVRPDEVDQVIFTHLHWDHTGWNTIEENGDLKLTFPNARYVVQQKEYDFWTSGGDLPSNGPNYDRVIAPIENAGKMDLVGEEHAVTSEVLTIPMPGHTPGHVAFGISSGGEHAYVVGDGAHKPVQISEPDWYPGFDLDPVASTKNRHAIFDRAEGENAIIAAGHVAFPSMGRATQVNGKRVFEYLS